jgi:hypothetical protein
MRSLWLIALCACFGFSQAGSKIIDSSRVLAFQVGRRELLTAGGTTLGLAALWGSFYQRIQVDEANYDERKTRLFKCLDSVPFAEVLEVNPASLSIHVHCCLNKSYRSGALVLRLPCLNCAAAHFDLV